MDRMAENWYTVSAIESRVSHTKHMICINKNSFVPTHLHHKKKTIIFLLLLLRRVNPKSDTSAHRHIECVDGKAIARCRFTFHWAQRRAMTRRDAHSHILKLFMVFPLNWRDDEEAKKK